MEAGVVFEKGRFVEGKTLQGFRFTPCSLKSMAVSLETSGVICLLGLWQMGPGSVCRKRSKYV